MKLLTFVREGEYRLGVKLDGGVLDVAGASLHQPDMPSTIEQLLKGGAAARAALQDLVERSRDAETELLDEAALTLAPCVNHPGKIICVGLNYLRHARETNSEIPEYPILFNKFTNSLAGQGEAVPLTRESDQVDYEAELAIVIGSTAKHVDKSSALDYVFGYCNANDLSARDLQMRTSQWLLGKSCDKFLPLGPYVVTSDEVGDPNRLAIRCEVNGEVRQQSNTADMIFPCDEIVSYVSRFMTLEPGDLILTGTPEGVMLGRPADQRAYLKDGDMVTVEIERLGTLTNRMVLER